MENNIKKLIKYKFIPDTNIRLNQTQDINKVCPISGCKINNNKTGKTINKLTKNLRYLFEVNLEPNINDKEIIKNGFKTSIG